ncbi:MAG: hypothetical protein K2Q01_11285, partial [Rickettsiales bacterium]|nr:hypothetical protein [Rickettsiales bacterium]
MLRIFLFISVFLALVAPAHADSSHIRSAFQFADDKDWHNAQAHAKASGDAALQKLVTWQYVMD